MVNFRTLYISISGSGAIRFLPFRHSIQTNEALTDFIVKKLELCGAREHGLLKAKCSTPRWQLRYAGTQEQQIGRSTQPANAAQQSDSWSSWNSQHQTALAAASSPMPNTRPLIVVYIPGVACQPISDEQYATAMRNTEAQPARLCPGSTCLGFQPRQAPPCHETPGFNYNVPPYLAPPMPTQTTFASQDSSRSAIKLLAEALSKLTAASPTPLCGVWTGETSLRLCSHG